MINVLYSPLVVCFCLMFPKTKYEYDLLLLRQNDSLYFIYTCILHYYRMFSIPFQCTLYLLYTSRGVFIWRINYCHCQLLSLSVWCSCDSTTPVVVYPLPWPLLVGGVRCSRWLMIVRVELSTMSGCKVC